MAPTQGTEKAIKLVVDSEEIKKLLYTWYRGGITDKHLMIALKNLLERYA